MKIKDLPLGKFYIPSNIASLAVYKYDEEKSISFYSDIKIERNQDFTFNYIPLIGTVEITIEDNKLPSGQMKNLPTGVYISELGSPVVVKTEDNLCIIIYLHNAIEIDNPHNLNDNYRPFVGSIIIHES